MATRTNKIIFLLFIFLHCSYAVYRFVKLENNFTIFFNTENNQRTIFFCDETNNCSNVDAWENLDSLNTPLFMEKYTDEEFAKIYNKVHYVDDSIRACILYDGVFSELGYIYQIEIARLKIIEDFNYFVDYIPNVGISNTAEAIKNLSLQKYNVIIGTSQDHSDIYTNYDKYPNITFLMVDISYLDGILKNNKNGLINLYAWNYFYQIRYLSGIVGGLNTKSKETCFIAPTLYPNFIKHINYYYLGLNEIDPNIKLYVYPINTFSNSSLELYALLKCIEEHPNVDLIAYHTDNAIIPEKASELGLKVIGYSVEGRILYGENILTSIQINWYNIFYDFFKNIKENNFVNLNYIDYSLQNDGYSLSDFSKLVSSQNENYIKEIQYGMANNIYNINCTNSMGILCERLEKGSCDNSCIKLSLFKWLNNSNLVIYPVVQIPEKKISYIYIDFDKTWVASLFLFLDVLIICYFLVSIIYLIYDLSNNEKKNINAEFLIISFIGAIFLVIGSSVVFGIPTILKCEMQISLLTIGFDLFYLPFFSRIARIFILKKNSGGGLVIKNYILHLFVTIFLVFEIAYNIVWFYFSPLTVQKILIKNTSLEESYYLDCGYEDYSKGNIFLLICVFFKVIITLICWILSDAVSTMGYKMSGWNAEKKKRFKQVTNASELKITVVLTFIILVVLAICLLTIKADVITKFITISITVYVFVTACTITIMISLIKESSLFPFFSSKSSQDNTKTSFDGSATDVTLDSLKK